MRKELDYIFTSGGIGPTHDDITSKSISKALKVKLTLNSEAKGRLEKHYSDDILTNARLKMAYIPENASLIDNPVSIAPGFAIKNIFVFPGVPEILKIMFKDFIKSLAKQKKYYKRNVTTTLSEGIIGDFVEKGAMLGQIDQRTPTNILDQSESDLDAAKVRLENAEAQYNFQVALI